MDHKMSPSFSVPDNILEPLFIASESSTLSKALESLIETAKTSDGRSDLASKHILLPVLELCQSPFQLSNQDLLLSIKLLRNLCAGEIKNQNLFTGHNGVAILLAIINSLGLTSGSDYGILRMVLQVLGNVSLGGEEHRIVVWQQFFPLGFLDIARVQSEETCDPLCMIIYTCTEGSNERSAELLANPGLDILIEIIRTAAAAGFKEDWLKSLLSRICIEESGLLSIFSKLSPVVAAGHCDNSVAQINCLGAEQPFLLRILSEVLNERIGDIVISGEFSLCIFEILRSAVGIVDFSLRGNSPLPTGSAVIDVMGYTLSSLREISACDGLKVPDQDEKGDAVDSLVSAGLMELLITLLRDLEPPATIRKSMIHSEAKDGTTLHFSKYCPYKGFRRDVVAIIGNCSYHRKHVQDEIRKQDGVLLMLQQCVTDEYNPFLREWGIWSMRNILEGNKENQQLVANLELQGSMDIPEIAGMGLRVEVDQKTGRARLVNA